MIVECRLVPPVPYPEDWKEVYLGFLEEGLTSNEAWDKMKEVRSLAHIETKIVRK